MRALAPFPVPDGADAADPAVQLFVQRAPGLDPGTLAEDDVAAIARACRRLDGLPLAIELGAARAHALGLPLLLERLDGRLDLLSGGRRTADRRHRNLRAVVEWSHGLLTADEALLFARLAVFPGSFGLDQAEAVCADDRLPSPSVGPLLARLVDQSLLQRVGDRFTLLETLRAYAAERLDAAERDRLQRRHARDTADRLAAESARLWTSAEPAAVAALTGLVDDLHAAFRLRRRARPPARAPARRRRPRLRLLPPAPRPAPLGVRRRGAGRRRGRAGFVAGTRHRRRRRLDGRADGRGRAARRARRRRRGRSRRTRPLSRPARCAPTSRCSPTGPTRRSTATARWRRRGGRRASRCRRCCSSWPPPTRC